MRRRTYEVTGMSPQSRTVAQLLNGFVSRGTLYPPLKAVLVRKERMLQRVLGRGEARTRGSTFASPGGYQRDRSALLGGMRCPCRTGRLRERERDLLVRCLLLVADRGQAACHNIPMKAMSYLASLLGERHCAYGRRPNVEMPEKTESAW